jgi:dTDP-4-dehydrorhamnose reductase
VATIAVTGATGFVGGTVAAVLAGKGHDVVCLVRRAVELPWPSRLVDVGDSDAIARGLEGCDAVAHLAILNDFHGMYADRKAAQDGYVGLTRRVVDAANLTGARVAYVSTDWVFDGTGHLVDEEEPPNPVNFYGFVARVGGVQGLHQTQVSGPRSQDVGFGYFVLSLVDALRAGGRFLVWEDPDINSYATPIVSPEIGALLSRAVEREVGGVLHFAGGTVVSRRELALATCEVFGLDASRLDFGPPPDAARLPAPVPYDTSMSADRTMALLGATAHPIEAQLAALEVELDTGAPAPIS